MDTNKKQIIYDLKLIKDKYFIKFPDYQNSLEYAMKSIEKNQEAIDWINNIMNNSNVVGCNLGDLQLLLDILEDNT